MTEKNIFTAKVRPGREEAEMIRVSIGAGRGIGLCAAVLACFLLARGKVSKRACSALPIIINNQFERITALPPQGGIHVSKKPPLHYYVFTPLAGQGPYYKGYGFLDLQTDSLAQALDRFHDLKDSGH